MDRFIRHGAWCGKCRASLDYTGCRREKGLSVYECNAGETAGTWQAVGTAWEKSADDLIGSQGPWSLLVGTSVGQGADGEPVLGDFSFAKVLVREKGSAIFREMEGDEPPPDNHINDCRARPIHQSFDEIERERYGGVEDDDSDELPEDDDAG
jgi:hypothetical protein